MWDKPRSTGITTHSQETKRRKKRRKSERKGKVNEGKGNGDGKTGGEVFEVFRN
jgi:hypothetical protein